MYYSLTDKVLKETIANTIKQHFTTLINLLSKDVVPYMAARHKAIVNKREIASLEKSINKYEEKINEHHKSIIYCRERIAKLSG
jgi:cob(I)alamin adenosyltransferase